MGLVKLFCIFISCLDYIFGATQGVIGRPITSPEMQMLLICQSKHLARFDVFVRVRAGVSSLLYLPFLFALEVRICIGNECNDQQYGAGYKPVATFRMSTLFDGCL